jgi:hypothetical protein
MVLTFLSVSDNFKTYKIYTKIESFFEREIYYYFFKMAGSYKL